ncbi:MAG: hypothetical protein KatS3mg108_3028 [Isosphaeraceae bacterium]|jgi:hypothetical protein|nr:MAG: hypothetical protein KatS3mg108_3028 [Isosphaeraceae bacterium]
MSLGDQPIESIEAEPVTPREIVAFETSQRQRAIPLRGPDLLRSLANAPDLSPAERLLWYRFARLLAALLHHQFFEFAQDLLDSYAPLDPDRDTARIPGATPDRTESSDEQFLQRLDLALQRANFSQLELSAVEAAIRSPNELGLTYIPNIELFEHLRVYVRGRTQVRRLFRSWRTGFRRRSTLLDAFQRMIVVLKFREGRSLDEHARTDVLYLRLFKNVPFVDMEMHLPEQATRVRMRVIDKAQIASPLIVGLPLFAFKLLTASLVSPMAIGGILAGPISAGVKSFFGFQNAKQRHMHRMIRSLYYLTLATNSSVIHWISDAAEDEDFKEVALAYFLLWRAQAHAQLWDRDQLDAEAERWLQRISGRDVDFDAHDALNKLLRLGLIQQLPAGLHVLPIEHAIASLSQQWDHQFRPPQAEPTPSLPTAHPTSGREPSGPGLVGTPTAG